MTSSVTRAAIVALAIAGIATSAEARRWKPPRHPLPASETTGVPTSIYDGDTFRFGKICSATTMLKRRLRSA